MQAKRRGKPIAVAVLLVPLFIFLCVVVSAVRRSNAAGDFLRDASALQLHSSSLGQVQQLAARYRGHIEPSTCDPHGCAYFFSFDNAWLHRLRLAPYTQFTSTLGVKDGALAYRRVFLTTSNKGGLDFGAFVEEWISYPKGLQDLKEPFDVRLQPVVGSESVRWRVHVSLTADATPEQHRIAYGLNVKCLSRIGGCQDAQQLLPSVSWGQSRTAWRTEMILPTASGLLRPKSAKRP